MRPLRLTITAACVFLLLPQGLRAQEGPRHQGFWIGFGIGGGSVSIEDSNAEALSGGAAYVRLGGTLSQRWLLGGEAMVWGRNENDVSYVRSNTTFTAMFYPSTQAGFYLKGGLGFSYISISSGVLGPQLSASRGGGGFTLGAGFDIRLGSNIYLTPNLDWMFQAIDMNNGNTEKANIGLVSLGLVWH